MATLKVTGRGRVMLPQEVLEHLGINVGETLEINMLPGGSVQLKAMKKKNSIGDLFGLLQDKTNGVQLTIEEINETIAQVGATKGK